MLLALEPPLHPLNGLPFISSSGVFFSLVGGTVCYDPCQYSWSAGGFTIVIVVLAERGREEDSAPPLSSSDT
jgi:hypothetical protein